MDFLNDSKVRILRQASIKCVLTQYP